MSKFKIGDRVMVIGTISGTVIDINPNGVIVECDEPSKGVEIYQYPNKMVLWPNESQVELIAPSRYELHITCNDSKTTNAVYKVNGKIEKRTEAVCAPSDTFNFNTGAELAINRVLYGTDYNPKDVAFKPTQPIAPQEDKPKFKVGQRVIATDNVKHFVRKPATILAIDKSKTPFQVKFDERGQVMWCHSEDIEPYVEPEKEPEPVYYNGKVVCVENNNAYSDYWTIGKVYEVVDGRMYRDNRNGIYESKATNPSELKPNIYAKFIEYRGEA